MAVLMKHNDTKKDSLRSIAVLGFNMHIHMPKAVLSTVKIYNAINALALSTYIPIFGFDIAKFLLKVIKQRFQ